MKPTHASHAEAVKARWHSRRHATPDAQRQARETYQNKSTSTRAK